MMRSLSNKPSTSGHWRASAPSLLLLVLLLPILAQARRELSNLNTILVRPGQSIQFDCNPRYVVKNPFVKTILGLQISRVVEGKRTLIAEYFPFGDPREVTASPPALKGWRVAYYGGAGRGKSHNNRFTIHLLATKADSSIEDAGIYICSVQFVLNKVLVKRETASFIRVTNKGGNSSALMRVKHQSQMDTDDYYYYDYDYQDNVKLTGNQNHHNLTELEDGSNRIEISLILLFSTLSALIATSF